MPSFAASIQCPDGRVDLNVPDHWIQKLEREGGATFYEDRRDWSLRVDLSLAGVAGSNGGVSGAALMQAKASRHGVDVHQLDSCDMMVTYRNSVPSRLLNVLICFR